MSVGARATLAYFMGRTALKTARAQEPLTVGFVYVGPKNDGGWTQSHDIGRLHIERALGVKTIYQESVPEGADAERVIRDMVNKGAGLVFTTSYGFLPATVNVAAQFPDVKFVHISGYVPDLPADGNLATLFGWQDEARYVCGRVAGAMSPTGTLGMVAAFPIPEVIRAVNAYALGARKSNPNATVKVVFTNTWHDPQKETNAAEALLDAGVDVMAQYQDSPAVAQAAEKRGVYAVGNDLDMSKGLVEPPHPYDLDGIVTNQLTAPVWVWDKEYERITRSVIDGTFKGENRIAHWADGITGLAPLHADVLARPDVVAMVEAETAAFTSGAQSNFTTFAGKSVTDLLGMNTFVEGVEGELPE